MLVQIVAGQTFYVDPSYTDAITGQTHSITGEELFFGVNAFALLSDALPVLQAGDSLYINGLSSESITVPETVSLYLTDSAAPLLRIGQDTAAASYSGDIVTVISGSMFGSESGWLVARTGKIDGNVSIMIENSVLGSGWPIGRETPQLRLTESCTFGTNTKTVSLTIRDSEINEDISLLHDSVIGTKDNPATVTLTLERVSVPINKWFWLSNNSTQKVSYADVVFNITDSTLGNSGTTALSVTYDQSTQDAFLGNVTYNIDGVYFSGRLYPVTTWSPSYPYPIGHTGVFTVNVTGGSNRIEAVSGFDVVNIASGALLFTDDFSGNKTVNVAGELRAPSISSGTEIHLLSGGTISGPTDLSGANFATVESGSVVDFDIADLSPYDRAVILKLSVLDNIPDFVLTVSPLQYNGFYTIATEALGFNKTITVRNIADGGELGTLAVGETAEFLGKTYKLELSGGGLKLTVRGDNAASVSGYTVRSGRKVFVSTGQTAEDTTVLRGGEFRVIHEGVATGTTVNFGGVMVVSNGGTAEGVTVDSLGRLTISGGTATGIVENGGYVDVMNNAAVTFAPHSFSGLMLSRGSATIHSGTTAYDTKIGLGGIVQVSSGGIVYDTLIGSDGKMQVFSGGAAEGVTVDSLGRLAVSGGTADMAEVQSGGSLYLDNGGKLTGRLKFSSGAVVSAEEGGVIDFDLTRTSAGEAALVNDLSLICGTPVYTLTVNMDMKAGSYVYTLADGAAGFDKTISIVNTAGGSLGTLAVGETLQVGAVSYTLNLTGSLLSVTVEGAVLPPPDDLVGTPDGVSWEAPGAELFVVEYSTDGFEHVISVVTTGNAVDTPDLPAGTYQWRVKADGGEWAVGTAIESENDPGAKVVQAVEDGSDDLFFASADGAWDGTYYARHVGSVNDWTGTNELVSANGKDRIRNFFFGSADPNVLCLTDGENGDAIFVDDVYTDLPEGVAENTARLYRIQEIRAGAGDDIVDMTSQQFEYTGEGLTIRGGDGGDTIWANKGDNALFGDAGDDRIVGASGDDVIVGGIGNDRMHGGGGKDVFAFCDNWGADTVQQLTGGSVTLWFASGDMKKWDAETLTYTDGENRIEVKGVAAGQIELKFGDDGSEQFVALAGIGAFDAFTSRKVFEESGAGFLASM